MNFCKEEKAYVTKVGILSMQRIYNYGSFLQAYGLKKILEDLGCDVEFVDYHPGKCLLPVSGGKGILRKLSKAIEVFQYHAPLKEKLRFIKYKKNYAANYYSYLGVDEIRNYTPELDLLVIGSDEVFNCVQNNINVGFAPELFGEGNHANRLISYAASFGNTTVQKLEQYKIRDIVAKWIINFDAVSVRDANSGSIVKELTGISPVYCFDPVLAYDFIGRCKDIPANVPEADYMILYGYTGRFSKEECSVIRFYAIKNNVKIFCIGGVQDCCDKYIDCNPFQVIAYFQHAKYVVTDTFHGTILSVITHRQFVAIVRCSGYSNYEKMTDLLKRLQLEDRILTKISDMDSIINKEINYINTDVIIKMERKRSYNYLREEIELCTQN